MSDPTSLVLLIAGVLAGFLLFLRHPALPPAEGSVTPCRVSVVIPARNEERNLPMLLRDLAAQTTPLLEVICVDDGSDDGTAEVAASLGAEVIVPAEAPAGWTGKAWACQSGANHARGDLLLFLDADVRLGPDSVERIVQASANCRCPVSVLPYHRVERWYEQLSLFFNAILLAANGVGLPGKSHNIGLFGPVILIDEQQYRSIGGHSTVSASVVDDLALGETLTSSGIDFELFVGSSDDVMFRMYPEGLRQLAEGWTKNFATGASKTPLRLLLLVVLWVDSCIAVLLKLATPSTYLEPVSLAISLVVLVVLIGHLWTVARRIGSFKPVTVLLYPIALLAFLVIFALSAYHTLLRRRVRWRGRSVELGG